MLVAFSSALPNGWIWDDDAHVLGSPVLQDPDGLRRIWKDREATPQYYPLTHTSFWLERRLWGTETWANGRVVPEAFGFHLDNVLLHAAAAVLLWRLLRRLALPGAWFASALFALHPITVESVAWVTERKNVLSTFFALASAVVFLDYAQRKRITKLVLSAALFLCALLSKTVVASLPAVLLLLLWWRRVPLEKRIVLPLLVMLAFGGAMGAYTAHLERTQVGAEGIAWDFDFLERSLIAGRAIWLYAEKLVTPWTLNFVYPRWEVDAGSAVQYLYPLSAILLVLLAFFLRRKIGRGPVVALLIYGGVLFPALGFLNVYPHRFSFVADHFQHHAAIALLVLFAAGLTRLPWFRPAEEGELDGPFGAPQPTRSILSCAVLLGVLGALSWNQSRKYEDKETLWTTTIEHNPTASIAYNNLGKLAYEEIDERGNHKPRDEEAALQLFRKAVESDERNLEAWNNVGLVLLEMVRLEEAEPCLLRAIQGDRPFLDAYLNLGSLYMRRGETAEAIRVLEEANRIHPKGPIPKACATLGALYYATGDLETAEQRFAVAIEAGVPHATLPLDYARTLHRLGKIERALHFYEQAARNPRTEQSALLAMVWIRSSHEQTSFRSGDQAVRLAESLQRRAASADFSVLDAAAAAYAEAARYEKAIELAQRAAKEAQDIGKTAAKQRIQERLRLYQGGQPYRSPFGLPD